MINNRVVNEPEPLDCENLRSTESIEFRDRPPFFVSLRKGPWKWPQSDRERKLLCICAILMALALAFLVALGVVVAKKLSCEAVPFKKDDFGECRSPTCQKAARALSDSMDTSVDPCHDFYRYACGGWIDKHPIPDDKSRYTTFDALRDELSDKLAKSLKEATDQNHTTSVINAAALFQGCLDEDAREASGINPLKDILSEFGGWPMTNPEWEDTNHKWYKTVPSMIRVLGLTTIIGLSVEADANQTSQHIIYLDQAGFGLGRNQLLNLTASKRNIEIVEAYRDYIVSSAKLLNPNANETQLMNDAEEMIQFESALARFTKPPEEKRDAKSWYHKMTVAEVQKKTENQYFSWTDFLNDVIGDFGKVTDETEVILSALDYINNALKLVNETSPRVLANYIGWMVVMPLGPLTTKAFRENKFWFNKVQTGVLKQENLERVCTDQVVKMLGFAVGRLYVDEFFSEESKKDADQLVEDIRYAYKLTLESNAWMDEVTKKKALEKLESMISMMGYPPWIKDNDKLNEYYKMETNVKRDQFFISFMNVRKSRVEYQLSKWKKPTNRTTEWVTTPPVVNAFYNPSANTITFPAGILNPPFYEFGRSRTGNYGGIGSVIGHEVSHGFDDQGSEFDPEGNLINWWTKETKDKFNEKAQCFREQYSSYVEPTTNMKLNGNNSVGENIADNGGLRNAFIAYKMQMLLKEDNNIITSKRLPGISATPEQLFFISYASIWCGTQRKESLEMSIQYDTHSPPEFRVTVVLANSRAFSEAFNCPLGSRMNPENKCLMW